MTALYGSTAEERFWAKVDKTDSCWLWTAATTHGYGCFDAKPFGTALAHRIAYLLLVGPIPEGLHLDHLCRVTKCVNPAHLEPVTGAENSRRAHAARTHCKSGRHPLTSGPCEPCRRENAAAVAGVPRTSSDGDSRRRPRQINLRLTDTELADLERLAAANGCTPQAVLRAGLILLTTTETP